MARIRYEMNVEAVALELKSLIGASADSASRIAKD